MKKTIIRRLQAQTQLLSGFMLLMAALLFAGCQATGEESTLAAELEVQCENPRPEVCTFEYRPVCALRESDRGAGTEWQTYSNGCKACSDVTVIGHNAKPCNESPAEE